jgi:hypothetical protein
MTPKRARAAARWIMIVAALVVGVPAYAASDGASGTAFYTSCVATAEIVGGQRKLSEPESGISPFEQATMCFGSVTAIANLEAFFPASICNVSAAR